MNIKDLLNCVPGTEVIGFPVCIKIARKTWRDADSRLWQDVVFIDHSGEMEGQIYLPPLEDEVEFGQKRVGQNHVWKSKDNIAVIKGEIQESDTRKKQANKLVVLECFNAATPLSYDQRQSWMSSEAEEWAEARKEEIRGKIRHGISCALISALEKGEALIPPPEKVKGAINAWVDYIMTGE